MQANNGTHDEGWVLAAHTKSMLTEEDGQQEIDAHTMKANKKSMAHKKSMHRCSRDEGQQEFNARDAHTMKAINQLYVHPPNWTEAHVCIHPFGGGHPMKATLSKQAFKEAWAKDALVNVVAKQTPKEAWANEALAQARWAKAYGKEAVFANGYWSIAELRCDGKKKRIMANAHKDTPPQRLPCVLKCSPPCIYCTREPSVEL